MKTYLTIWFSSEGAEPTTVAQKLQSMGFKPIKGHYDHVYDWKRSNIRRRAAAPQQCARNPQRLKSLVQDRNRLT